MNLTDEQKREITKINLRYAEKYQKLKAKGASDEKLDAYRDKMYDKRIKKYNKILTDEQVAKLKSSNNNLKNDEMTMDKAERQREIKEKAQEKGVTKDELKEKKENRDEKMEDKRKDDVKEKAQEKGVTKDELKEKKEQKDND